MFYLTHLKMKKKTDQQTPSIGEDVEQHTLLVGNQSITVNMTVLRKLHVYLPAILLLGIYPR